MIRFMVFTDEASTREEPCSMNLDVFDDTVTTIDSKIIIKKQIYTEEAIIKMKMTEVF